MLQIYDTGMIYAKMPGGINMVTIDGIIRNVGKFNGELNNHRNYERAKENVERIRNDPGLVRLEEMLRESSGYDAFNLPQEPQSNIVHEGDVTVTIRSERTTRRPQYKAAVQGMENYLNGINLLLSEGRVITGVAKEYGKWCIDAERILEQYELILAGVKSAGLKQTIRCEVSGVMKKYLEKDKTGDLDLTDAFSDVLSGAFDASSGKISPQSLWNYVRAERMLKESEKYVSDYERALGSGKKESGVVPINTRKGYLERVTESEGISWSFVANTLVNQSDDPERIGELNILADPSMSISCKRKELPFYEIFPRTVRGKSRAYIGLESIYDRLQDLKSQESVVSRRVAYQAKEIV